MNFDHRRPNHYWPYSSIQPEGVLPVELDQQFIIEKQFPTSHNWDPYEPERWYLRTPNMYCNLNIPLTRRLGVQYLYVCRRHS